MNESTGSTNSYNLLNFSESIEEPVRSNLTVSSNAVADTSGSNPFDSAMQKVEQCGDNCGSPHVIHMMDRGADKEGKLIDLFDSPTDKENKNEINTKARSCSPPSKPKVSKRDNLLKMSVVNQAAKSGGDLEMKKFSERWRNILTHDDSLQDIMKQELTLVESFDTDLSDYEYEMRIPMLTQAKTNENAEEKVRMASIIEKFNEIKENSTKKADELKTVANKLKEVGSNGNKEIDDLVNKLCMALGKNEISEHNVTPVTIVRQDTFELEEPSPELAQKSSHDVTMKNVVDQVTKALGNVNLGNVNVISSDESKAAPTIIVVVNQNESTVSAPETENTPPKKPGRLSQMFKSAKASYTETPRATNIRRRSVSFSTSATPTPSSKQPSTPSTNTVTTRNRSFIQNTVEPPAPPPPARKSFMDSMKPKFGIMKKTNVPANSNEKKEKGPMKATVPLKSVIKSTTSGPAVQTPQKPPATPSRNVTRPSPMSQRRSVGVLPEPPVTLRTPKPLVNLQNRRSLLPPAPTAGTANSSNLKRRSFIATVPSKAVKK